MTITRSEVLHRAESVWPFEGVPYSQSQIHQPDGYRQDCSGYVSMCWAIPLTAPDSWGGMNTVTLVMDGWMHEIDPNDLKPGDAIGKCGPGTAGNAGHVQIFVRWLTTTDHNDSHYWCLEQTGGSSGPHRRTHDWPSGYKAYRFKDIVDDPAPAPVPVHVPASSPVTLAHFEPGSRTVRRGSRGTDVAVVQRFIGPAQCGAPDGDFGPKTEAGVRWYQKRRGLRIDGVVGPVTWRNILGR